MISVGIPWYEYNYTGTSIDGSYSYFITGTDNSSNTKVSSTKTFNAVGVRAKNLSELDDAFADDKQGGDTND